MNPHSCFFKTVAVVTAVIFISVPVLAQGTATEDSDDYLQGKMDGERDARSSGVWFFAGCCFGLPGVILAYVVKPTPSTAVLIGRSQAYINGYIEGYKSKSASKQGKMALYGLGTACAVTAVLYIVLIALATSADDDYYY